MVRHHVELNQREIHCLTEAIYHEARGEPDSGQAGVAQVVLNRTQFGDEFGSTICKVVYQKGQFSWTRQERFSMTRRHHNQKLFLTLQHKAEIWIIEYNAGINLVPARLQDATFFSIGRPYAHHLKYQGHVGHQKFYSNSEYIVDAMKVEPNSEAYDVF